MGAHRSFASVAILCLSVGVISLAREITYRETAINLTALLSTLKVPGQGSCSCGLGEKSGDPRKTPVKRCGEKLTGKARSLQPKMQCPKCVCREGWVQNAYGHCVPEKDCNKCKRYENEVFLTCSTPPLICGKPIPRILALRCMQGCFCVEGFIRKSKKGPCVPIETCPFTCGENQEFTTCLTGCEPVCNLPVPASCVKKCSLLGCKCKAGFVLRELVPIGRPSCVPESQCANPD